MERRPRDDFSSTYPSSPSFTNNHNLRNLPPANATAAAALPMTEQWLLDQIGYNHVQLPEAANPYYPYPPPRNSPLRSNNSSYQDNSSVFDLESQVGNLSLSSRAPPSLDGSSSWSNVPNDSMLADKLLMNPQLNSDYAPYSSHPSQHYEELTRRVRTQAAFEHMYRQQVQAQAAAAAMGIYNHLDDSNPLLHPSYLYNNNLQTGLAGGRSLFGSSSYTNNGGGSLFRSAASSRYPSNQYGLDNDYGNGNGSDNFLRSSRRSNPNPNPRSRTSSVYNSHSSSSNLPGGSSSSNRFVGSLSSLDELKGNIVEVACNKPLSLLLLKKFDEGTEKEVDLIFVEVKDNLLGLMENQLEKFLIEGFFKLCNEEQIYQILLVLVSDEERLEKICTTGHGTRRMQELLQYVTTQEHRDVIIPSLAKITLSLTMSDSGHHVILKCLGLFEPEENNHLFSVVTKHFYEIATDKSGCCVIQQCVDKAQGKAKELLIGEVIANAAVLSEHSYGNYVVQYILLLEKPHITEELLGQLESNYVSLSMNKYGSNVVEKCLKHSNDEQAARIIKEIIDNSQQALMVFQNAFGNYVAQCAIDRSKGAIRHKMQELVLANSHHLHSHPHGKRVLAKFKPTRQRGY